MAWAWQRNINWHDAIDNAPLHYTDYATHYAQTDAVCSFLGNAGRVWGNSPFFLAGYPEGTLFDIDNKAIALASCAIHFAGLSLAHAFNVTVLGLIAMSPFAVFAGALVAGVGPGQAAIAQILGLAFWYGDPTISGTGRVTAEYDRLRVGDASPGGVVIKYHWMKTLQIRPISLSVRPVFVAPDPVPFISVENGEVREFVILHGRY
jgi:hypothetical protein